VREEGMRSNKIKTTILLVLCLLLSISTAHAQAFETTISDILANPDKYDHEMVQVEGKVIAPKFNTSQTGNPYTTFKLSNASGRTLNVFDYGTLSIKEGDIVRVCGSYRKFEFAMPRYTIYYEIDASWGSVARIK
jgi:hypothetical protein